jgi:hypothetical protein
MLLRLYENCWRPSSSQVILAAPGDLQHCHCQCVKWCIVLIGGETLNMKLLCLLFDASLTVQQTNTCRGSSALLKFQSSFYFSTEVCLFSLLLHFQANTNEGNFRWSETIASLLGFSTCRSTNRFLQRELCHGEVLYLLLFSSSNLAFLPTTVFRCWNWWGNFSHCLELLHPLLHSPLAELQTGFCGESSATSKFDDCSCFQTRSDSLAYSSVSVLKLMRQIFIAYESTASPLAFPTGRSTNKSLQRELCHIAIWCLLMFFLTRSDFSTCHNIFGLKLMRDFYSICN